MNTIWWKRFRPINLLIVTLTQLFFVYLVLVPTFGSTDSYGIEFNIFLIIFFTLSAAAGGYVINDIKDVQIDQINKPYRAITNIVKWQWIYRSIFIIGFLASILVSFRLSSGWYVVTYLIVWFFLYAYSTKFKCVPLVGNVLVSVLSALVVLVVLGPFWRDFLELKSENQKVIVRPLMFYLMFAFLLSLIREIVKDLEDYEGDKRKSCNTLAVSIGDEKTKVFVLFFSVVFIVILIAWISFYWSEIPLVFVTYLGMVVILPMLAIIYKIPSIRGSRSCKKQQYHKVSSWLKYIMIAGILALSMEFYIV